MRSLNINSLLPFMTTVNPQNVQHAFLGKECLLCGAFPLETIGQYSLTVPVQALGLQFEALIQWLSRFSNT
jgi:hypothetical protein